MFKNVDWNTLYSFVFTVGGLGTAVGFVGKHFVHRLIEDHMHEIKEMLEPVIKRLDRIEYALYNDGKTGLINKVDALIENQQVIKTDVEVMKAKVEQ